MKTKDMVIIALMAALLVLFALAEKEDGNEF